MSGWGGITPILPFPHRGGRDPRPGPAGSCFRRNDVRGGGGTLPHPNLPPEGEGTPAPPLRVLAFAGMTSGGGGGTLPHPNLPPEGEGISRDPAPLDSCLRRNDEWGCAGTTRDGDAPAPRPCPGFPLSRERRWGCAGRAGVPAGGLSQAGHVGSGVGVAACQMDNPAMTFYSSGIA